MSNENFPAKQGFRMPAEWAAHEATWLSWPTSRDNWPDCIAQVENTYLHMIEALHMDEKVHILADSDADAAAVRQKIAVGGISDKNIFVHPIKTGDVWIRDYGPTFVTDNKELLAIDWIFNAWGEKYDELLADSAIPSLTAPIAGCELFSPGIVMEGGSIDVNGQGLCITTAQCLLNSNRNPELTKDKLERMLCDCIGLENVIWLKGGIAGDDTDGHVDDLARFVRADTIMIAKEDNANDENSRVLAENIECIREFSVRTGRKIDIVTMPMPSAVEHEGQRLPASFMNFYIANKTVLLPVFKDSQDSYATGLIQEYFPKHIVVPIDCRHLVRGFGAIHCASQQQPRAQVF